LPSKIPKNLERAYPYKKMIKIITTSDGPVQAALASFAVINFRLMDFTNSILAGGTGAFLSATTGLADMTAYALGRTVLCKIKITGSSYEGVNIDSINVVFSDTQVSTTVATFAQAKAAAISGLHTPIKKIPTTTGNPAFSLPKIKIAPYTVLGDTMVLTDRDFVTTVNPVAVAPNQEIWGAIIVTATNAATNLVLGLDVSFTIISTVEAFSRLPGT
jgi:hypothetical protein